MCWEEIKVKYVAQICNGKEIVNELEEDDEKTIAVYGSGGIFKYTDRFLHDGEAVLFGRKGTIGKPLYVNGKFWTVDTMFYMKCFNADAKYLFYVFKVFPWELYTKTTTLPSIVGSDIANCKINVCRSTSEQKAIVNFLDYKTMKIDKVINTLNQQVETLINAKKSLVTECLTRGLSFEAEMKDSEVDFIGEIPKHWDVRRLKYVLKPNCVNLRVGPFGSALKGDDFKEEGFWVYNQRCVLDNNFETNDTFVDEGKFRELKSFRVFPNDVLVTTRGTIGKVAVVPDEAYLGILHPCIIKFVVDENLIMNEIIRYIFNESNIISGQIFRDSNATTIEVLYSYNLKNLLIPLMPMEEQIEIINYLDKKCGAIDRIINVKKQQIEKLEIYKQSMIYDYVTGAKRVKGAN